MLCKIMQNVMQKVVLVHWMATSPVNFVTRALILSSFRSLPFPSKISVDVLRHPGPQAGKAIEFSIQAKTEAGSPGISKISGRILLCIFLCRHISGQRQHVPWDGSQSKIQSARLVRVHICSIHGIQNYEVSVSRGTQDSEFDTPTGRQTSYSALCPLHRSSQEAASKRRL